MRRILLALLLAGAARAGEPDHEGARLAGETSTLLAELDAEVVRLRRLARPEEAGALGREIVALRAALAGGPLPTSRKPAVHVVSFREGLPGSFGGLVRGEARVTLTCRDRPVVLVLASATAIRWDVRVAEGVDLRAVWTAGDPRHWVDGVRSSRVLRLGAATAWSRDAPEFVEFAGAIAERTSVPLVTFLGARVPPEAGAVEVGPGNPEWRAEALHNAADALHWNATRHRRVRERKRYGELRFEGLYHFREGTQLLASFGARTPLGPVLSEQRRLPPALGEDWTAARDPSGALYVAGAGCVQRLGDAGELVSLVPPETCPELRTVGAVALDARRRRLLVASCDRVGYLYAIDPASGAWSTINDMDGVAAAGMACDPDADAVYVTERAADGVRLHRFTPAGEHIGGWLLPLRSGPDRGRPLPVACAGGTLVLEEPPPAPLEGFAAGVARTHIVSPYSGAILATFVEEPAGSRDPMTPARLEALWARLLRPREAESAARDLAAGGDRTVAFLAPRLLRPDRPDAGDLQSWIALLDDPDGQVRLMAQGRIEAAGSAALVPLAEALPPTESAEARRRIEIAFQAVRAQGEQPPPVARELRAIAVLGHIDTPASVALLRQLVTREGSFWAVRADAALAALDRLATPRR